MMLKKVRDLISFYENKMKLTETDNVTNNENKTKTGKIKYNISTLRRRPAIYIKRNTVYRTKSTKSESDDNYDDDNRIDDDKVVQEQQRTPTSPEPKSNDIFTEDEDFNDDTYGENEDIILKEAIIEAYNYPQSDLRILEIFNYNINTRSEVDVIDRMIEKVNSQAMGKRKNLPKYKSKSSETILSNTLLRKKRSRTSFNKSVANLTNILNNNRSSLTLFMDPQDLDYSTSTWYTDQNKIGPSIEITEPPSTRNSLSDENDVMENKDFNVKVRENNSDNNFNRNYLLSLPPIPIGGSIARNSMSDSDISRSSLRSSNRSYNRRSSLEELAAIQWFLNDENPSPSISSKSEDSRTNSMANEEDVISIFTCSDTEDIYDDNLNEELSQIKKKTKYDYIVEELINTEKSYAKTLEDILNDYVNYLEDNFNIQLIEDVKKLINYLRKIFHLTIDFIEDLDKSDGSWQTIVKAFVKNGELFELYPPYSLYKYKTDNFLRTKLADVLRDRQLQLKQSFDLPSYLLSPVQRLAKYKLMLNEFAKLNDSFKPLTHAIRLIDKQLRTGNNYIAFDSIRGLPYLSEYEIGSFVMRDKFFLKNIKKETVVFLFEKIIVFTTPMDGEVFVYQLSLKLSDTGLGSHHSGTSSFDLLHYTSNGKSKKKTKEVVYTLQATTHSVKKNWMRKIYRKLYEQMEEEKRKTANVFQNYTMLTSGSHVNDVKKKRDKHKKKSTAKNKTESIDSLELFAMY